jgi:hypothetical protein
MRAEFKIAAGSKCAPADNTGFAGYHHDSVYVSSLLSSRKHTNRYSFGSESATGRDKADKLQLQITELREKLGKTTTEFESYRERTRKMKE